MRRPLALLSVLFGLLTLWSFRPVAAEPSVAFRDPVDVAKIGFRVFTDEDGLPQNAINTIARDTKGYLWVGTKDGVAVYDGRAWRVVDLPKKGGSNWVNEILCAADGSIWFAMHDSGVVRLSGGQWTRYTTADGLATDEVLRLTERTLPGGTRQLWAGTKDGLGLFDGDRWQTITFRPPDPAGVRENVTAFVEQTLPDGRRALWAAVCSVGFVRIDDDGTRTVYADSSFTPYLASCMVETRALDGHPTLLAGTPDGVRRFDPVADRWVLYTGPSAGILARMPGQLYETTASDGSPVLWAARWGEVHRLEHGVWTRITVENRLPKAGLTSILQTASPAGTRTLWLGTDGSGLLQWEQGGWVTLDTSSGLTNPSVYSMLETADETGAPVFWVGMNTDGIARFGEGTVTILGEHAAANVHTARCMTEWVENGRRILLSGHSGGFQRVDGGRVTVWERSGLPFEYVQCLLKHVDDDGVARLWIGTSDGIVCYENGRFVAPSLSAPLPDPNVRCMLETVAPDGERTLWIGTAKGLVRSERGRTTVTDARSGLPGDIVMGLHETTSADGRRWLWIGTSGNGAARLDLSTPGATWETFSTETSPALPNDTVYSVVEDARGRLYLCTNRGVARLAPREPTAENPAPFDVYTFTTADGLPSNECNTGAAMVDSLGRIWVGTIKGAAIFDPSREVDDLSPRPLHVERVLLDGRPAALGEGTELGYDQNDLVFELSLLNYFRDGDTRYRSQMVGYDDAPSEWTPDFRRAYTNLSAGDYRFEAWAKNVNGVESGPVEMTFRIRPAPWRTWWAYLLYTLAGAAAVYASVRWRLRALERRGLELEAVIDRRTSELRASEQRALQANQAKSTFLSNMSHELRTPLNGILGFVQLLDRDRSLGPTHREALGVIMRSGEHLLGLINDVLSISKIEAGKETLVEQTFDLGRLLRSVEEMFRLRARARSLAFHVDAWEGPPRHAFGDEGKLRQVLINLLGNAFKFTEEGSVALHWRWEDGRAVFEVVDTGPGIAERDLPGLFTAFVQTGAGRRTSEGTGLGLAISRTFVRLMGGEITVESAEGEGTTFRVEIRLPEVEADRHERQRRVERLEPGQPEYRLLVVDDVAENRRILVRLLESAGFSVREACDGAEAVDAWATWRPHLIWMDLRMPVMDGLEATRRIRARCATQEAVDAVAPIVVALTASAFEDDRPAVFEAGCDDIVPKPYRESEIFAKLAEHLGATFEYEADETDGDGDAPPAGALAAERVAALPTAATGALRKALTEGDVEAARDAISRIAAIDAGAAAELEAMRRAYRFEHILDLLDGLRS